MCNAVLLVLCINPGLHSVDQSQTDWSWGTNRIRLADCACGTIWILTMNQHRFHQAYLLSWMHLQMVFAEFMAARRGNLCDIILWSISRFRYCRPYWPSRMTWRNSHLYLPEPITEQMFLTHLLTNLDATVNAWNRVSGFAVAWVKLCIHIDTEDCNI